MNSQDKQELWNLVQPLKVGMVTSADGGELRSRPMALVQDEFDGSLWFFTKLSSHKTLEVQNDHNVNVSFANTDKQRFVSLSGAASILRDQNVIDELWNPMIGAWFPEGRNSIDVALMKIDIHQAEYWDSNSGKLKLLFEFAKANVTHETPDLGENRKIS